MQSDATRLRALEQHVAEQAAQLQQRNAELAVISSVGLGLAKELDFQGIIDLVGDKIREIFNAQAIAIQLYDPRSNQITFPYLFEYGARHSIEPIPLGPGGFASQVI